ncbi:MAG TPA: phosphoribosylamine--glycine ligase, partial [Gemmatimonadaceae bacterium]|nr:phosphoribosylamine--glycine ligase [Gemmatimonadaceae bacterium]
GRANEAIDSLGAPVVVKASGLAAGKGVIVCHTVDEARAAAASMLEDGAFGPAGETILIEEFMTGEELSVFALTDGESAVLLPPAQDHKRLLDGDRGPNTGGMGAYCPVSLVDERPELLDIVVNDIVNPTLDAMRSRGTPFTGLLYVGLMVTCDGPKVVEFNCRFGDPEAQAVLPALGANAPLSELMYTIARGGTMAEEGVLATERCAVTTVLAARGYPESPITGDAIRLSSSPDTLVFHAGTKRDASGRLVTGGGRVLAVTGLGDTIADARDRSRSLADSIDFAGKQRRTDIASRELMRRAGAS